MKQLLILLFVSAGIFSAASAQRMVVTNNTLNLTQTATAATGGELLISDLSTIQKITFDQAAVQGYTIGFLMNGQYFTKTLDSDVFPGTLLDQMKALPDNTKIYFDNIKHTNGKSGAKTGSSLLVLKTSIK